MDVMPIVAPSRFGSAAIVTVVSADPEQNAVDHRLVLIRMSAIAAGTCTHVEVGYGQQLRFALGKPFLRRRALALRAMPVAAAVVRDDRVRAALAARDMSPKRRRAAALDGRHDLHLAEAHTTRVGETPCGAEVAEDVRDLQSWTRHECRAYASGWPFPPFLRSPARRGKLVEGASRRWRSCRWRHACSAPSCRACHDPRAPG